MNFSAETQDPHTFVVDVVNLVEHPFKKEKEGGGQKSKLSDKTPGALGSSATGLTGGLVTASPLRESAQPSVSGAESPARLPGTARAGF